jgi:hypothetical protein
VLNLDRGEKGRYSAAGHGGDGGPARPRGAARRGAARRGGRRTRIMVRKAQGSAEVSAERTKHVENVARSRALCLS